MTKADADEGLVRILEPSHKVLQLFNPGWIIVCGITRPGSQIPIASIYRTWEFPSLSIEVLKLDLWSMTIEKQCEHIAVVASDVTQVIPHMIAFEQAYSHGCTFGSVTDSSEDETTSVA